MKMNKHRIKIEGNRYLIYYTFERKDDSDNSEVKTSCYSESKKKSEQEGDKS